MPEFESVLEMCESDSVFGEGAKGVSLAKRGRVGNTVTVVTKKDPTLPSLKTGRDETYFAR